MSDPNPAPLAPVPPQPPTPLALDQAVQHLTIPQRNAFSALISAQPLKLAAEAGGVHRSTLNRWINFDPHFRAAYNAWQQESKELTKVKLLNVVGDALETVTAAIREGDRRLAYSLLKDLGLLSKIPDGLTDPDLLKQQMEFEQANLKRSLELPPNPTANPIPTNPAPPQSE